MDKCHNNCVGKEMCLQLVKQGKDEYLKKAIASINDRYPDKALTVWAIMMKKDIIKSLKEVR